VGRRYNAPYLQLLMKRKFLRPIMKVKKIGNPGGREGGRIYLRIASEACLPVVLHNKR